MRFRIKNNKQINPTKCALMTIESKTGRDINGNDVKPSPMTSNTYINIEETDVHKYKSSKGGQSIKNTEQSSDFV